MRDRQRFKYHRVDQAEDGSVGSDAESEREDRDGGKGGTLAQGAECVAKVLKSCVEHNSKQYGLFCVKDRP